MQAEPHRGYGALAHRASASQRLPPSLSHGFRNYGVGSGAVEPPGIGDGASDADPSVFDGFRFAAPALLCRVRSAGLGEAWAIAADVVLVPLVPCCWHEAMNATAIMPAIKHNRYFFMVSV